mmetsp:Transcript_13951/g.40092  ORF Transcript_13951/g.40092 Transcript_13951/m.40092 type:complete len:156 (+) Transcript_13951:223-690(+)
MNMRACFRRLGRRSPDAWPAADRFDTGPSSALANTAPPSRPPTDRRPPPRRCARIHVHVPWYACASAVFLSFRRSRPLNAPTLVPAGDRSNAHYIHSTINRSVDVLELVYLKLKSTAATELFILQVSVESIEIWVFALPLPGEYIQLLLDHLDGL